MDMTVLSATETYAEILIEPEGLKITFRVHRESTNVKSDARWTTRTIEDFHLEDPARLRIPKPRFYEARRRAVKAIMDKRQTSDYAFVVSDVDLSTNTVSVSVTGNRGITVFVFQVLKNSTKYTRREGPSVSNAVYRRAATRAKEGYYSALCDQKQVRKRADALV